MHVGSVAADRRSARGAVGRVAVDAEFRRQRDLVPAAGEQLGDESLVAAAAIDVGVSMKVTPRSRQRLSVASDSASSTSP
jgi:hypothetical protein